VARMLRRQRAGAAGWLRAGMLGLRGGGFHGGRRPASAPQQDKGLLLVKRAVARNARRRLTRTPRRSSGRSRRADRGRTRRASSTPSPHRRGISRILAERQRPPISAPFYLMLDELERTPAPWARVVADGHSPPRLHERFQNGGQCRGVAIGTSSGLRPWVGAWARAGRLSRSSLQGNQRQTACRRAAHGRAGRRPRGRRPAPARAVSPASARPPRGWS